MDGEEANEVIFVSVSSKFFGRRIYFLISILIFMFILPIGASAKDYYFPSVDIDVTVNSDGSFDVVENRTFDFDGDFSWAAYILPLYNEEREKFYDVTGFSISEGDVIYEESASSQPGTAQITRSGDVISAKWFFSASDEQRTFTIKYRVGNSIDVYSDLAQFYWKFIGTGWKKEIGNFVATVNLPEGASKKEIRAWGHGPLSGEVTILDSQTVKYEISNLPPEIFMEGRILFPTLLVPQAEIDFDEPILEDALVEEAEWAREANEAREKAKEELQRREKLSQMGMVASIIVALVGFVFFLFMWFMFGKEYKTDFEGEYYRELPADYPPAVMGYLWRFGSINTEDMVSTIMDLARRGHMKIKENVVIRKGFFKKKEDYDYTIAKMDKSSDGLKKFEKTLLNLLFNKVGNGQKVSLEEIKKYAKKHSSSFQSFFKNWKKEVVSDAKKQKFLERKGLVIGLNILVSMTVIIFGILILATWEISWGFIAIVSGIIQLLLSFLLKRRSYKAALQFQQWAAFRKFLLHFSNIKEALPSSMVIWEHYLIYAIGLGVAKEVIEQLKIVIPTINEGVATTYAGPAWFESSRGVGGLSGLESLSNSFASVSAVASSAMSSASGGGGG
ncbi:DUF2207 domain-containing protein [Candidatus Oleimmundimicrobium sp.]|uniref:DUF2207 domain-containing protein n=1 Tax=Candidatus Oleimmundimicrobium sp. TaxID=3060597 RepID=UPI0027185317|nr:DUF2207 domain-containing protein [Candidatus Oleimmundimicrobium sp.]MDO8885684.1 DUF2207 domain-containing protein [Candidatus Oleimmundimicrobium sp.]